jgi:hypothetical protein
MNSIKYAIPNVFLFRYDWESDFIVVRKNGNCLECEIKTNRQDFFRDFKKTMKHQILREGTRPPIPGHYTENPETGEWEEEPQDTDVEVKFRPNQFYYAVPEGLITVDEIPEYAGLIYITERGVKTVKRAPFLHREKLELEKKLCNKFYYYWLAEKQKVQGISAENKYLKTKLDECKGKGSESQGSIAN